MVTAEQAARIADTIARLEALLDDGLIVEDSRGRLVLNKAVSELRLQRAALTRTANLLRYEESDGRPVAESMTQRRARVAANARWSRSAEVRAGRGPF